jgi:MFS family permease
LALPAYEPWYPVVLPIFGFFVFGVFSGYAVYLPELFPTHIRSTAVGFCTGSARVITSLGPLVAGLLVGAFGQLQQGHDFPPARPKGAPVINFRSEGRRFPVGRVWYRHHIFDVTSGLKG